MGIDDLENFQLFCFENDILIHHVGDLSTRVRGYAYYDGTYYNVILNNKLDGQQLKKTTIHEIIHIMENHFNCSSEHIFECEQEVDYIIREMKLSFL